MDMQISVPNTIGGGLGWGVDVQKNRGQVLTDSSPANRTECRGQRAGPASFSAILAFCLHCPLSYSPGWSQ
jgi:hypothetical protein